jgi:hypothetical protein
MNQLTLIRINGENVRYFNWCRNILNIDPTPIRVLTWEKPNANWLKCNVDGATFIIEGKFGIGICFRDSMSSLVQTNIMIFPFARSYCY